jgi:hypothetical protein
MIEGNGHRRESAEPEAETIVSDGESELATASPQMGRPLWMEYLRQVNA